MGLNSSSRTNKVTDIPAAIDQTVALARYSNVSVKLSGALGNSLEPYPFRDMTVYVQRVFEAYGPERCHWATDVTNSLTKASYRQRVTHFTGRTQLPVAERQRLDHGASDPCPAEMGLTARSFS